jgi:hypothetical protein
MTTTTLGQYLNKNELINNIPDILVKPEDLGSTDTYHEEKILNKYLELDKEGQELIYKSALQLAIIGYGNKNYGFIRDSKDNVVTLIDIFKKYNIKYLEKLNSKYTDNELSVRRLLRLFRYQIQGFIIKNKKPSYLWNKYANKNNLEYISICFPGGEHLLDKKEEAIFMLDTYESLDIQFNTKFRSRLRRVFIARGILSPEYFINKNY